MVRSIPLSRERSWEQCAVCCIPRLLPLIPLLSRVEFLGEMSDVLHSRAPLPLIPPAPFSHTGRRGRLGVLMAETGDGTQGLAKKSTPVSILPAPFSHTGRRGRLGVLMAETENGRQGLAKKSTPVSIPPCPLLPHGEKREVGRPDA